MNPGNAAERPGEGGRDISILFDKVGFAAALSKLPDGVLVEVNEAWTQIFGYSRQEAVGRTTYELNINPDAEGRERIFTALQERGFAHNIELNLKTKSGSLRSFLTNIDIVEIGGQKYILNTAQDITERKRAEEQSRYLAMLLSHVNDAIIASDANFKITAWNAAAEALYGWKAEEVLGRNGLEIVQTEWPGQESEAIRRGITEAGCYRGEASQQRKDGSRFPVEVSTIVLYDDNKNITGYVSVNRDITEHKKIDESLRLDAVIMENMPAGVYMVRASDGTIQYTNPTFDRLFGYQPGEILGRHVSIINAPVGRLSSREVSEGIIKSLREKRSWQGEVYSLRKDGTCFWASASITMFDHGTHGPVWVAARQDITERKKTEEQLRELSQRLTYHVDNSPLAVIEWGPDMRLIRWSKEAERMFGWTAEEMLGKRIEDLNWVHEEDLQQVNEVSKELETGLNPNRFSANRNYRKDGSVAFCEWYNSSLVDEAGNLRSILSLVLDVTERRKAEIALRENEKQLHSLNESLEQKVLEKTAEVRNLSFNLIRAEQRERQRISHILHEDLQQRIYVIQMQLTFLREDTQTLNEKLSKKVVEIEREMGDILKITRHLSIDLSPPILHDEGLSQAVDWLAIQIKQRYNLPVELQAEGSFYVADKELHVLLFNCIRELLFNVVKHAQANTAAVTLQWVSDGLQVEVSDDGKGFIANDIAQHPEMPKTFGLPTIRHQLSLFGGRMEIHSEPGKGTRIVLTVPVAASN